DESTADDADQAECSGVRRSGSLPICRVSFPLSFHGPDDLRPSARSVSSAVHSPRAVKLESNSVKVVMIGTGYVGLVTGTCFADSGNDVICVDIDEKKVAGLKQGEIPIYEPGLTEMVLRNVKSGRLSFTTDVAECVPEAKCVFLAVGTPQSDDGAADLSFIMDRKSVV